MRTWRDLHPDWEYRVFDNADLVAWPFRNRHLIREYLKRGQFAGVADVMRYELLHRFGGYMAGADSICLRPIDELIREPRAYTVYENEEVASGIVAPVMACEPGNPFVGALIERLSRVSASDLGNPWESVGNYFVTEMIRELQPDITIWPSHFLIPEHPRGQPYRGSGPVYARQMWGATTSLYGRTKDSRPTWPWQLRRAVVRLRKEWFIRRARRAIQEG